MPHHWTLVVVFSGYIPIILTILFTVAFALFYTRRYASTTHSDWISKATVVSGLVFSLLTTLLIPIDVFFASYAKLPNGSYAEWANDSALLQDVEDTIEDTYFVFYSIVLIYTFAVLPFVYFYSEETSDTLMESTVWSRVRRATIYSIVFPVTLGLMLAIGALMPMRASPKNGTTWHEFNFMADELKESKGQDAFGFTFSILSAVGLCVLIMYLGLGMMAFPLSLIKGLASAAKERVAIQERQENLKARISVLKSRIQMGSASQEDYAILTDLQHQEAESLRHERYISEFQLSVWYRCRKLIRPLQIFFGFGGLILSGLVLVSLLLTNIDKAANSGADSGYILKQTTLPNPIDYVLLECQKVYPIDYILFVTLICYLFVCCIYAIQRFGIWCCCFKAYSIKRGKTLPQAMVMLCGILIFCVFGLNILIYSVSPEYTSFGSQHYRDVNGTVLPCNYDAPPGQCVQTRATSLLSRFNYKMNAFGFGYYWLSWLFILVSVGGYFVFQFKVRASAARQREEEEEDLIH